MEINSLLNVTASLYIDPAATSILLTSISGIAIAVGATAIILWRKFKKGVAKVLNIDENANKEVEDEVVVNDVEETEEAPAEEATAEETEEAPAEEAAAEENTEA